MTTTIDDTLWLVLSQALDEGAFIFVEPCDEPDIFGDIIYSAEVTYSGTHSGVIQLFACEELVAEVTRNMLGMDGFEDPSPEDALAAFGEMLNIIAGIFVPTAF